MKKNNKNTILKGKWTGRLRLPATLLILGVLFLTSCGKDYLDIVPKGQKQPSTVDDYRRFLENTSLATHANVYLKKHLVNEIWQNQNTFTTPPSRNNYLWIEEPGARIDATQIDGAYSSAYNALFYCNLVINNVPTLKLGSQKDIKEGEVVVAQAKVYRALFLFHLINTYAKAYNPATATTDNGIPFLSTASDFETPIFQKTVAEIYQIIMNDLNVAIPALEETAIHFMLPNKMAAVGLRARVNLFMQHYDAALADAEEVLGKYNFIYDMVSYHHTNIDPNNIGRTIQDNQAAFSALPAVGFTDAKAENIWAVGGQINLDYRPAFPTSYSIPLQNPPGSQNYSRGPERFEDGDTRFLCNFFRNTTAGCYQYQRSDYGNTGGIRTLEMFLIRAECYARKDGQSNIDKAMDDLDAIRIKRIIADKYQKLKGNVSTKTAAIQFIRHERDIELMGTDMMFYDMKRFNVEPEYRRTMVKTDDNGQVRTLRPESDLWIMPFPKEVTSKNANIKQNTSI